MKYIFKLIIVILWLATYPIWYVVQLLDIIVKAIWYFNFKHHHPWLWNIIINVPSKNQSGRLVYPKEYYANPWNFLIGKKTKRI